MRNLSRSFVYIFISAIMIGLLVFMSDSVISSNDKEETRILENAVSRSITQCYALDGAYPPNINYLVNHYGLSYDQDKYFIDYQYIGANLRPDVTIIKRN